MSDVPQALWDALTELVKVLTDTIKEFNKKMKKDR